MGQILNIELGKYSEVPKKNADGTYTSFFTNDNGEKREKNLPFPTAKTPTKKEFVTLANCYYHWAGYTTSAIYEAEKIKNWLKENEPVEKTPDLSSSFMAMVKSLKNEAEGIKNVDWRKRAVIAFYETGAGHSDRNDGLVAIDEKGIEETRSWATATIKIDIEKIEFVFFDVCEKHDTLEELIDDWGYASVDEFKKENKVIEIDEEFDFNNGEHLQILINQAQAEIEEDKVQYIKFKNSYLSAI